MGKDEPSPHPWGKSTDDHPPEPAVSRRGLSSEEAERLLQQYGYNEITEKRTYAIVKFLKFFWGPIPIMIEVAAILAVVIHHWETFYIITAMLVLNAGVSFWQRQRADNAINLLKQKLALKARVHRDGQWVDKPARELVPGDLVRVRLGDIVPADVQLIDSGYMLVDQSVLTGESLPVEKNEGDIAYSGTIIRQGERDARVVDTGMNTYFGRTTKLVEEARTESHFQKALIKIGDYLMILGLAMVAIIFLVAMFRHENLLVTLQYALVLTVAAVPATLPAVLSVTMAVGAGVLAAKGAIARRMSAIDEVAGMDILCSDKTGTITQNALTAGEVRPFGRFGIEDVLIFGTLASREEDQDPIDVAIINKTREVTQTENVRHEFSVSDFKPFDPVSKRTEALVQDSSGSRFRVTKGAPQVILSLLNGNEVISQEVNQLVEGFAEKGYRSLGIAKTDLQGGWEYVGLVALYDPPREDSAQTIKTAITMGVDVKMVTGDHTAIAREVARKVNLGTDIQRAASFMDKPDREAQRIVESAEGFAEVFPEHKYHIVELLQARGHIVGMTGDGVNDAPALKKADVGIAVAGATDAARSAAHIVLTRPGLSVIIDAIQESRKIFQRMNSYAIYRIGGIIRVLLFITLSILIFNFYPVTAVMIVLQTLLNDIPILSIAYDNARSGSEPERWDMRVVVAVSAYLGLMGVIFSFSLFFVGLEVLRLNRDVIQTLIFLKLTVAGYFDIFMGRTRSIFWSIRPGALLLWSGVVSRALATAIAVFGWYVTPISWKLALLVWGWSIGELFITDPLKILLYRVLDHRGIIFHRHLPPGSTTQESVPALH